MQREALEGANTNTAVLTTMKNAADALKAAHKHMYVKFIYLHTKYVFFCFWSKRGNLTKIKYDK